MLKYPRTSSSNSSGFFEDDDLMEIYQTPPQSPILSATSLLSTPSPTVVSYGTTNVSHCLQRHIVRMFSANDASGTSAVAIDNKIEQAMDLVKSHLMIAVREEVEVLKEKISELMDKINQLEVENTLLKANISQETLQQLQMQTQLQIAGSGQTAGNNMITAPPQPPSSTAAAVVTAPGTATTVTAQNVAANNTANANNQVVPNTISNSNGSAATAEGSGSATPTAAAAPSAENPNIANSSQANNANNAGDANNASNGTATGSVVTAGSTNGPMS